MEKGLGVCATTLVERARSRSETSSPAGAAWGKCRALQDEFGNSLRKRARVYTRAARGLDTARIAPRARVSRARGTDPRSCGR